MSETRQLSYEEATAFYDARKWEPMTLAERCRFQLYQERLCMPFDKFHEAVEKVLGRPVFTHELARPERLRDELEGKRESLDPLDSLRAIVGPDKPIIVVNPDVR